MNEGSSCCGRLKGRLVHEEGNLAQLARQASIRKGKGLLIHPEFLARIEDAKRAVATCKQVINEHAAEHAGEVEVA